MARNTLISVVSGFFMITAAALVANTQTPVIFSAIDQPSYRPLYDAIYSIIDANADELSIALSYMPNVRQLTAIDTGKTDGIGIRSDVGEDALPTLLKVEPPLFRATTTFAIPKDAKDIADKASLDSRKIAVLNGSAHCQDIVPQNSKVMVNSHISGLKMVVARRVDAMCILDLAYYAALASSPGLAAKLQVAQLSSKVSYSAYIHPRKQPLLPALESAVRKSTKYDQLQRVYDRILDDLKSRLRVEERY